MPKCERIEPFGRKSLLRRDALSRHPMSDKPIDHLDVVESFLNCPSDTDQFPAQHDTLRQAQEADDQVLSLLDDKDLHFVKTIGGHKLVCRRLRGDQWRIVLPDSSVPDVIEWHHVCLGHPGVTTTHATIGACFCAPKLPQKIQTRIKQCGPCRRQKSGRWGCGHLPERADHPGPFEQVAVDCIGPWKIKIAERDPIKVFALTCTCTGSNLTELAELDNKTSEHVTIKFENTWLCRHPRPGECAHDQGGEFKGAAFQAMLATNGVRSVPIAVKNPQGNSIAERMHRVVGDMIGTQLDGADLSNIADADLFVDAVLASATLGLRATVHTTSTVSPGAAAFGTDMWINVPVSVDWEMIRQRKRARTTCNNKQENAKRRFKDFQVGEMAHLKNDSRRKLAQKNLGPFRIDQVHANGTATHELDGGAFEQVNIRGIDPDA